jgi:hypothetical protein
MDDTTAVEMISAAERTQFSGMHIVQIFQPGRLVAAAFQERAHLGHDECMRSGE